jgi:hypothetical protein
MRPRNSNSCSSRDGSGVWTHQPIGELQQHTLATPGRAQQDARITRENLERDIFQNLFAFKSNGYVLEDKDRL